MLRLLWPLHRLVRGLGCEVLVDLKEGGKGGTDMGGEDALHHPTVQRNLWSMWEVLRSLAIPIS